MATIKVRKMENSSQFGIFIDGELVEGGFFSKDAALEVASEYANTPSIL